MTTTDRVYRSCPTCEASCGLVLEIDTSDNRVLSIKGDAGDSRSNGYVCAKSQAFAHIHADPERLRKPVKRLGEDWIEIEWEQAFAEVAARLADTRDQFGKDAIAMYYGNPNGHNFHTQIYTQLFIQMLDTERFFSAGSVDQQPKNLSCELLYGNAWLFPVPDLQRTDFFVCMGGNPLVSQGSLLGAPDAAAHLRGIRERGGKVVVIDPRRTETAAAADKHLFIRPGSDALMLFAWVNELFRQGMIDLGHLAERTEGLDRLQQLAAPFTPEAVAPKTGIAADDLRALISDFARAERPSLYGRIGLCTQAFGTLSSWLVDIVNLLQGRLDAEGGAMFARPATGQNEATGEVPELMHGRWHSRARGFPEYMGMLPASCMAEELECVGKDAVHALITVAGNPVLSVPNGKRIDTAMNRVDFIVALDFYINETTRHADYILPSTTQLEHSNYDFLFSAFAQRNFARYSPKVFAPHQDSQDQYQIILELMARMNGLKIADLQALMLDGLIDTVLTSSDSSELDGDAIRAATLQHSDGERLLDILLRAGPYGDGFDDSASGLNLDKVKASPHGIDLGPLQSGILPQLLRTEAGKISVLHPLLEADIKRLTLAMSEPIPELVLIGRRHIRDMNSWLHNLSNYARGKNRCTLMIHPDDANSRGLTDGGQAIIHSTVGELEVPIEFNRELMPGVVSLPHGFGHRYSGTRQSTASSTLPGVSANDIVDDAPLDVPSGTSVVNGVPVTVKPAPIA
ncbi:MAG: molybdopterin-dependent oxidoreductase [Pseudomonadota bacterium]